MTMLIEKAEHGKMSPFGSALLRSLQNNSLPDLDLLVREAIQNSLDAALESDKHKSVIIDMGIREINVPSLATHFDGINDTLIDRYKDSKSKALYISDTNTTGLTGELDYRLGLEKAGNIYKLIYGINIPQEKEGAGGSWGLGKTIYFRLGIGLVIYYTRIQKDNGDFEERLAATLVENEKDPNSLLYKDSEWNRGIAWWGQRLTENSDDTIPLTNKDEINDILHSLNIEPFKDSETGTKIIIPFINENLSRISESNSNWWEESIESYLKIAVQRWYAPRLNNPAYPYGKWLDFRINGNILTKGDMEKTFSEIQLLYNIASKPSNIENTKTLEKAGYHIREVRIGSILEKSKGKIPNAGLIAFKKYTREELNMVPPYNAASPFEHIDRENINDTTNSPIVTYVRKPGMLVNYEVSGSWCNKIEVGNDEYLLAIFVPNSYTKINSITTPNLEEYLRQSEEADHASWCNIPVDGKSNRLVSSIQNAMRKALSEVSQQKEKPKTDLGTTLLAKKFGKVLLPPRGYGKRLNGTDKKPKKPANPSGGTSRKDRFTIKSRHYDDNGNLIVSFSLKATKIVQQTVLDLIILSEKGTIKADDWESENSIGTAFPIEIKDYKLTQNKDTSCLLEYITSNTYGVKNGLIIKNDGQEISLDGDLILNSTDPLVQFSITHNFEEEQS